MVRLSSIPSRRFFPFARNCAECIQQNLLPHTGRCLVTGQLPTTAWQLPFTLGLLVYESGQLRALKTLPSEQPMSQISHLCYSRNAPDQATSEGLLSMNAHAPTDHLQMYNTSHILIRFAALLQLKLLQTSHYRTASSLNDKDLHAMSFYLSYCNSTPRSQTTPSN